MSLVLRPRGDSWSHQSPNKRTFCIKQHRANDYQLLISAAKMGEWTGAYSVLVTLWASIWWLPFPTCHLLTLLSLCNEENALKYFEKSGWEEKTKCCYQGGHFLYPQAFVFVLAESSACLLFQHITAAWDGNTAHLSQGQGGRQRAEEKTTSVCDCMFAFSCSQLITLWRTQSVFSGQWGAAGPHTIWSKMLLSVVLLLYVVLIEARDTY